MASQTFAVIQMVALREVDVPPPPMHSLLLSVRTGGTNTEMKSLADNIFDRGTIGFGKGIEFIQPKYNHLT